LICNSRKTFCTRFRRLHSVADAKYFNHSVFLARSAELRQAEHAGGSGDVAATNSEAGCRIVDRDGYDEGDQHLPAVVPARKINK
jgi:hypothetical protein